MRPKTKESVSVSIRMDINILKQLEQFCQDSGQNKTNAIERALAFYIRDYYAKQKLIDQQYNPQ